MHFTPVHCSWMNQVEQWFSILQRKRLAAPRFDDLADLEWTGPDQAEPVGVDRDAGPLVGIAREAVHG